MYVPMVRIARLLCHDFIMMVIVAIVIASPLGMVWTSGLLNFAYKIELPWITFTFTVVLALTLAVLTVSVQAIKAALEKPISSLRSE